MLSVNESNDMMDEDGRMRSGRGNRIPNGKLSILKGSRTLLHSTPRA